MLEVRRLLPKPTPEYQAAQRRLEQVSEAVDELHRDLKAYQDYYQDQLSYAEIDRWTDEIYELNAQLPGFSGSALINDEGKIKRAIERLANRLHYELSGQTQTQTIDPEDKVLFEQRRSLLDLVEAVLLQLDRLDTIQPGAKFKPGYVLLRRTGGDLKDEIRRVTNTNLPAAIPVFEKKINDLGATIRSFFEE